jgi:ech hydrogenase subunit A
MYFFWEVTTLCSFLLISHDGTAQAIKNGLRALWINMLGGLAFIAGIIFIYDTVHTISIEEIIRSAPLAGFGSLLPLGLGLLCFAGFTKSAQFPFQSWLLGAMVAPTPVSALLHSSTMVKAGVYLIVRLAPAYSGSKLADIVAVVGGFTFLAGSAIAISQSNAKRVLAYSTIANLGIIICCAGIGTPLAIGAAILLIIFHAVSKALLFLCVGTIEQGIGSRDIEDMQGLMKIMPFTAVITIIGMVSMLLPPFGVLITKLLTIEASVVKSPVVLVLIILGSALTVVFWAKWIGIMMTMSYRQKFKKEELPLSVKSALSILFVAVLACSVCIAPIFNSLVWPQIAKYYMIGDFSGSIWSTAGIGDFPVIYFFVLFFGILLLVPYFISKTKPEAVKPPYLCGENVSDDMKGLEFMSPADKKEKTIVHNYYMSGFFGENNLTLWTNVIAGAIILIMFGVIL